MIFSGGGHLFARVKSDIKIKQQTILAMNALVVVGAHEVDIFPLIIIATFRFVISQFC
jgi:hypothetical protein